MVNALPGVLSHKSQIVITGRSRGQHDIISATAPSKRPGKLICHLLTSMYTDDFQGGTQVIHIFSKATQIFQHVSAQCAAA